MSDTLHLAGSLVVLAGSVFLFLGGLGLLRMPDVYNRLQAGTKATTLGSIFVLAGLGIYNPQWIARMIILIIFIIVTNPVSSHALARAAHFAGVRLARGSVCDRLAADESRREEDGNGPEQGAGAGSCGPEGEEAGGSC